MSCRKIIQPVPSFSTEIEEHQPTEKVESSSDIGLLFCGNDETAAFTDFKEWKRYLTESIELDSADVEAIPKGTYTVMVDFKIEIDGSLSVVSISNDTGYDLSTIILESIRKYNRKWHPAQQSGKNITSYRRQPITFVIEE